MRGRCVRPAAIVCALTVILGPWAAARAGMESSRHNLSAGGPVARSRVASGAETRIVAEARGEEICVYCHTPHSAVARRGLWSRALPSVNYKLYESSTTEAELQQPTGSSRLCLSCHDGRVASDSGGRGPRSRAPAVRVEGAAVLGTDLSDDHPISFVYDTALVTRRRELVEPRGVPPEVKLDDNGQMQCTSCHDPHRDRFAHFLVRDPSKSSLCVACHDVKLWNTSSHAISTVRPRQGPADAATVAELGCAGCHRMHAAEHPERLLRSQEEENLCFSCHNGDVARFDLRAEFNKPSAHRVDRSVDVHDPTEDPRVMPRHVECVDCHNPHQARAQNDVGFVPGPLTGVSGVNIDGSFERTANADYEVCLRCHGVAESTEPLVIRADNVTNTRLEIDPRNASTHPIVEPRLGAIIPGLVAPLTPTSRITCTSCHGNEAETGSGLAPRGPHGSIYEPLLREEYRFESTAGAESHSTYALCFRCHDRTVLLSEMRGPFPHRTHVVDEETSCAVCHDAHGSRRNAHLINFMTRDAARNAVVTPSAGGRLEYEPIGRGGRCYLSCHGVNHEGRSYPEGVLP